MGRPSNFSGNSGGGGGGVSTPDFHDVNPYAHYGRVPTTSTSTNGGKSHRRWQPMQGIVHSKESMALRSAIGSILNQVYEHTSAETLEIRANTPQYRLEKGDWVMHNAQANNIDVPIKTVARLPLSLLDMSKAAGQAISTHTLGRHLAHDGYLWKRGESASSTMKRRYMVLQDKVMRYYQKPPESSRKLFGGAPKVKGSIKLDDVSLVRPFQGQPTNHVIELVTSDRTWVLQAESDGDYQEWVRVLCHSVKFQCVDVVFRRMLQLAEVDASGANEVRLVTLPSCSVKETVEHVFNCYHNMLEAVPLHVYDPNDYVLKVTGYRDYLIEDNQPVGRYKHVRECILTKKTLCLTLVHKSKIEEACDQVDDEIFKTYTKSTGSNSRHGLRQMSNRRPSWNCTTLEYDHLDDMDMYDHSALLPSSQCMDTLRFSINRVVHIPRHTTHVHRTAHAKGVMTRPLQYANCVVQIELVHAGQRVELVGETSDIRLKSLPPPPTKAAGATTPLPDLIGVWLAPKAFATRLRVCQIPRSARIVFTLFGVSADGRERIMTTGWNVFDVDGMLVPGEHFVQFLDNTHTCTTGAVPHVVFPDQPFLQTEHTHQYVEFDWRVDNPATTSTPGAGLPLTTWIKEDETVARLSPRSPTLNRAGWLQKTGKNHKTTAFKLRWFSLDQFDRTLSYQESPTPSPAPLQVIPLAGAEILRDDLLNKVLTDKLTATTRREIQTWVFKVRPANGTREYILSAETSQERESWVNALQLVASEDWVDDKLLLPTRALSSVHCRSGHKVLQYLRNLIQTDPLYRLSAFEKSVMWDNRYDLMDCFEALPRVLTCVNWLSAREVAEVSSLLTRWAAPSHPAGYIALLDKEFACDVVRTFAVDKLSEMADTTFSYFLPQLVQALKYENHHVSPLAKHLIKRAIENPNQIGFDLFWAMKVETYNDQFKERYGLLLNTYVDVCSHKMKTILEIQDKLFAEKGEFETICQEIKALHHRGVTGDDLKQALRDKLTELNPKLPNSYQLPIDPRVEVGKILVHKCKVMSSAKLPLWLEFENAEDGGDPVVIIFKAGDDVRQDCLTLQLIRLMDEMWREADKDLAMEPYRCVSTGPMTGMLQVVLNAVTTKVIHTRAGTGKLLGKAMGSFNKNCFVDWIKENNPRDSAAKAAGDLFLRSCAGYCVATYVLGIGDRHSDNIMVTQQGRYFHIDFGHFLGYIKYQPVAGVAWKRETTPFVFTPAMAEVFHATSKVTGRHEMDRFGRTAGEAFNVVRGHMHLLVSLFLLMIPADMPELQRAQDINYVVASLYPKMTPPDAYSLFGELINKCLHDKWKSVDDVLHAWKHSK
ncbi:hypothetical protein DYB37_004484 [Aphanomyces astaci]|uniref:phosphatidylinositol 3-kinase n=1 Tax=Aphanomyces astaci TaxID=112090 RepID=A0A418D509_APHAT|nr:hypothetical protein DYB35_004474 [Aphanomyces astaci]RHZ21347.1 hypothetical protein DYB37_004484 [Aphanomyces astaci]